MIHSIARVAESRFVKASELLDFVRSEKCPEGVIDLDTDDPYTTTWYVDSIVEAFYANGGKRLSHDEILKAHFAHPVPTAAS